MKQAAEGQHILVSELLISCYVSIRRVRRLVAIIPTDRSFKSQFGNQFNSALIGVFLHWITMVSTCSLKTLSWPDEVKTALRAAFSIVL